MCYTVTLSGYQTLCHLHVTDLGPHDLILGQPWLWSNNPDIDWAQRTLRPRIQGPQCPTQITVAPNSGAPWTTSSKDIPVISSLQASRALRHGASGYLALVRTAETTAETTTATPPPTSTTTGTTTPTQSTPSLPTPDLSANDQPASEFQAEAILKRRRRKIGDKVVEEFLIKWRDRGNQDNLWMPVEDVDQNLLTNFRRLPKELQY